MRNGEKSYRKVKQTKIQECSKAKYEADGHSPIWLEYFPSIQCTYTNIKMMPTNNQPRFNITFDQGFPISALVIIGQCRQHVWLSTFF